MRGLVRSMAMMVLLTGCGGCLVNEYVSVDGERLRVLSSQKDVQNRYRFTLRLWGDNGVCSGILVSPHLVLTAAHCVCQEREGEEGETVMDAAHCQEAVTIETVNYQNAAEEDDPGTGQEYDGSVRAHAGFKLVEGGERPLKSIKADLALIRLNQAVEGIPVAKWRKPSAVKKNEFIFMVGYGFFEKDAKKFGERRFGPNAVTAVDDEKFQLGKPGSHMMDGDSGGACIRETKNGPELVGIMSSGGAPAKNSSTCMNVYSQPVQSWLNQELKLAGDAL